MLTVVLIPAHQLIPASRSPLPAYHSIPAATPRPNSAYPKWHLTSFAFSPETQSHTYSAALVSTITTSPHVALPPMAPTRHGHTHAHPAPYHS
ncbi:hypothetical protein P171DRAFT_435789 [Karstenula rhodostoma CBS 690.94]|uniref:Uncharacterized protein n=1 Tax=Karstenula rhodostoma CBS 690.94 TaxID=1392251 RepID=A0A9P4U7A3_9PLEO|nr:hypothetical protein P171DRAFT_435789 [Karstenula rhodostoma CBS 690.94]